MATIFESHFAKQNTSSVSSKPTQSEVEAFGQALKRPEFRAMLCDYVQELSDPVNRSEFTSKLSGFWKISSKWSSGNFESEDSQ